jgi:hypothetical protein
VFVERVKHMLLAMVGQSPCVVNATLIMTSEADGCRTAETIDWRRAWDRDYLSELQTQVRGEPSATRAPQRE